jgi:hypothetical protein
VSQRPASGLLANLFEFLSFSVPEQTQTLQVIRGENPGNKRRQSFLLLRLANLWAVAEFIVRDWVIYC